MTGHGCVLIDFLYAERARALWCGGRDSNPCSPRARDLESCAFGPLGLAWLCHPRPIHNCFLWLIIVSETDGKLELVATA